MKIRFTSIAWKDVSNVFSKVTVPLETEFQEFFSDLSYGAGVDQFVAVAIAAGDWDENKLWLKKHNKTGIYTSMLTKEKVKFISFGLPFAPHEVEGKNERELDSIFCGALCKKLYAPDIKIPKDFDYEKFSSDMKGLIDKHLKRQES